MAASALLKLVNNLVLLKTFSIFLCAEYFFVLHLLKADTMFERSLCL